MAKKELVKLDPTPVAVAASAILPSLIGASEELKARMEEVRENMESVENFKLPRAKMTAEGFELIEGEAPITEIEGVLIHTKKTNVYYAKPYNRNDITAPDCYSLDGVSPAADLKDEKGAPKKPVNPTCKGCPMAEFGTNSMKSGKACRNLKPLYMLLSDEAIMPRQITVTPASIKVANQYLMDLTERGVAYRKVKTRIIAYKDDPRDTYMKLRFVMGAKLTEQQVRDVEFLKNQWKPVMDNQLIDQRELDRTDAPPVQPHVNGEF